MEELQIFNELEFESGFKVNDKKLDDFIKTITEAPIDIRDALEDYIPQADEFQIQVIDAPENTIRVIAPAGSGKTQTVINRSLAKIRGGTKPERLLLLTFDNSAAKSISEKLDEQTEALELNSSNQPIVKTLNAFGYQMLREYVPDECKSVIENYRRFRLFKEVKDALQEKSSDRYRSLPNKIKDNYFLEYFSLMKNELLDPRELSAQEVADFMLGKVESEPFFENLVEKDSVYYLIQSIIWLYKAYDLAMKREGLIDFDDQKLRAYKEIIKSPSLKNLIQNKFDEIIVDEFQDINKLDFELLKVLSEKSNFVVVGDDDQAIYGFRGCTPEYIINLDKHIERKVATYELSKNYRCPANIVHHADTLIRNNLNRVPKNPVPTITKNATIKITSSLSSSIEARIIRSSIQNIRKQNRRKSNFSYKDFAVLYRTNAQSLPLQIEFILEGIPYHVRKEDNILSNEILDRIISVLQLKLDLESGKHPSTNDAVATIKSYFKFINHTEEDKLNQYFSKNTDFYRAIKSRIFYSDVLPKAEKSKLHTAINELSQSENLMDALDVLSKRFKGLSGMVGSLEDVLDQKVPLGEIFDLAVKFKGNIRDFIFSINQALAIAKENNAGNDEETGVSLRTYFRAKGLQWHTVILTTCNDGLIPHTKSPIEDERRLFYVALTRASSNLLISYVKNVCNNKVKPSRFLIEAKLI